MKWRFHCHKAIKDQLNTRLAHIIQSLSKHSWSTFYVTGTDLAVKSVCLPVSLPSMLVACDIFRLLLLEV